MTSSWSGVASVVRLLSDCLIVAEDQLYNHSCDDFIKAGFFPQIRGGEGPVCEILWHSPANANKGRAQHSVNLQRQIFKLMIVCLLQMCHKSSMALGRREVPHPVRGSTKGSGSVFLHVASQCLPQSMSSLTD